MKLEREKRVRQRKRTRCNEIWRELLLREKLDTKIVKRKLEVPYM